MVTAGKSYLCPGSMIPTPHHIVISPANGIFPPKDSAWVFRSGLHCLSAVPSA